MMPDGVVRTSAIQNRRFLIRAVRHLTLDYGIRQFLGRSLFWCGVARKR
jgi:S-adenosyl methyltransferase